MTTHKTIQRRPGEIARVGGIPIVFGPHWILVSLALLPPLWWEVSSHRSFGAHLSGSVGLMAIVLFSVTVHEAAHAAAARARGLTVLAIHISPMFGLTRLEDDLDDPADELIVAAAGPAANLAVVVACATLLALPVHWPEVPDLLLRVALGLNVWLALPNLLPLCPLDGGRIAHALLRLAGAGHLAATAPVSLLTIATAVAVPLAVARGAFTLPSMIVPAVLYGFLALMALLGVAMLISAATPDPDSASDNAMQGPELERAA